MRSAFCSRPPMLQRGVERGRAEAVPRRRVGRVEVAPRVDHERARRRTSSNESWSLWACAPMPRTPTSPQRTITYRSRRAHARSSRRPGRRRARAGCGSSRPAWSNRWRAIAWSARAVVAERQEAAVVRVADLRREAVGPRVVGREREHALEPRRRSPSGSRPGPERVGGLGRRTRTARTRAGGTGSRPRGRSRPARTWCSISASSSADRPVGPARAPRAPRRRARRRAAARRRRRGSGCRGPPPTRGASG